VVSVRGERHWRCGVKSTSPGPYCVVRPSRSRSAACAQTARPSRPRTLKAISAAPSARFAPSQSQPDASSESSVLDHS
jgi:hypothetical protein